MTDLEKFHQTLNQHSPDEILTQQEATEAFHNLTGFMSLLIKVNEREKIIPLSNIENEGDYE